MKKVRPIELWQVAMLAGAHYEGKNAYGQSKYKMCAEFKSGSGWRYFGWGIPGVPKKSNCYVKSNPSGDYLYVELGNGDIDRYLLNDDVKRVLNIL